MRRTLPYTLVILFLAAGCAASQQGMETQTGGTQQPASVPAVQVQSQSQAQTRTRPVADETQLYDEVTPGTQLIAEALARAAKDNKRVLIQWGANWCGWCKQLDAMMKSDREVAREMLYEYEKVLIDVGQFDKNLDLMEKYGANWKTEGVPYLTILSADGRVVTNQGTVLFENNGASAAEGHDPALVLRWLKKFEPRPQVAEDVLKAGLAEAEKTQRLVFMHSGAPW